MVNEQAEAVKSEGNELVKIGKFAEAVKKYKAAIKIDPTCAVYWSNLAFCYHEIRDLLAYKEAAAKCVEVDPSFIKGYYWLAHAHQGLFEMEEGKAVLERGLQVDPNHPELQNMHKKLLDNLNFRAKFQERTLKPPKSNLPYLGGEGAGFCGSKIPKNSLYGDPGLRPPLPPLSSRYQILSKYRKETRPVLERFFQGNLRVKWLVQESYFTIEGYMPDEKVPVVSVVATRTLGGFGRSNFTVGSRTAQNQVYHHVLTNDQKMHLQIIIIHRFLRECGAIMNANTLNCMLWELVQQVLEHSNKNDFYENAADIALVFSDIAINHGSEHSTAVVAKFCEALEAAKRYEVAANIYVEIAEAKVFPRHPSCSEGMAFGYAALAYKREQDFVLAERYYVASLRAAGQNWHWNTDRIVDNNLQNMMIFYETAHRAVLSGMKTDPAHKNMQRANALLVGLLSIAGFNCQGNTLFMNPQPYQTIVKDEYKTPQRAYEAVMYATMALSIEEYHGRLFSCGEMCLFIDVDRTDPNFDQSALQKEQEALQKDQKRKSKHAARSYQNNINTSVFLESCSGCNKAVEEMAGRCPCRTVQYCSKECQVSHWKVHKRFCPNKNKK